MYIKYDYLIKIGQKTYENRVDVKLLIKKFCNSKLESYKNVNLLN